MVFQGYLKEVQRNFQIVSKKFQGCLKGRYPMKVFPDSFKVISRKIKGCFRYPKEVQRLFLGSFKDVLRKFQGCKKV